MSQKNETTVLVLTLLITAALVGGGFWWFTNRSSTNLVKNQSTTAETFAQVQNVPSGLFRYGGSTTWAPLRTEADLAIQTVWPQFRLLYTDPISGAPGSSSGIKMLLDNQLTFSQSSRPIKDEEYGQAQTRGFTLKEIAVGIDGIAVAVNPNLNVAGLTIAQLKDIYTGKIRNWSQVGGPNLAIAPFSRRLEEGGTIEFFVENVLQGDKFANNVQFIPTTTEALRRLSQTSGGIYYASAPEVVGQCSVKPLPLGRTPAEFIPPYQEPFVPLSQCPQERNRLNIQAFKSGQYPITRNLFVVVKQNGQTDQQAGEAYARLLLSIQGQESIAKAGFVSIR